MAVGTEERRAEAPNCAINTAAKIENLAGSYHQRAAGVRGTELNDGLSVTRKKYNYPHLFGVDRARHVVWREFLGIWISCNLEDNVRQGGDSPTIEGVRVRREVILGLKRFRDCADRGRVHSDVAAAQLQRGILVLLRGHALAADADPTQRTLV